MLAFAATGTANTVTKNHLAVTVTLSPASPHVGQTLVATARLTNTGKTAVKVSFNTTLSGPSSGQGIATPRQTLGAGKSVTFPMKERLTSSDRGAWKLNATAVSGTTHVTATASTRVTS